MRPAIESLLTGSYVERLEAPAHPGLAYDKWRPLNPKSDDAREKEVHARDQQQWMEWVERARVPADYPVAYSRWLDSFQQDQSRAVEARLCSRMLLGHGNPSPTEVGLTLHHTWGVPLIPGTAVKGLVASYLLAHHGPDSDSIHPLNVAHTEPDRALWQGVHWNDKRIVHGPGAAYRMLFGSPGAESDDRWLGSDGPDLPESAEQWLAQCLNGDAEAVADPKQRKGWLVGERQGLVTFHDALLVPDPAQINQPFLVHDVLTVHQREYYNHHSKQGQTIPGTWPNDYDAPNPVSFLTVRPGLRFLFPLSGPVEWTALARNVLKNALTEWGVGGKTTSGYGRFDPASFRDVIKPSHPGSAALTEFVEWLALIEPRLRSGALVQRQVLDFLETEWLAKLSSLDQDGRKEAAMRIRKLIKSDPQKVRREAFLARLGV